MDDDDLGGYGSEDQILSARPTRGGGGNKKPTPTSSTTSVKPSASAAKSKPSTSSAVKPKPRTASATSKSNGKTRGKVVRGVQKVDVEEEEEEEDGDREGEEEDEGERLQKEMDALADDQDEDEDQDEDMDKPPVKTTTRGKGKKQEEEKENGQGQSQAVSGKGRGTGKGAGLKEKEKEKSSARGRRGTKGVEEGERNEEDGGDEDEEEENRMKDLESELASLKSLLSRRTEERDTYAQQFKKLSEVKSGEKEGDKMYEKVREKGEVRAKAQDGIITTLQTLNDSLKSKLFKLEGELSASQVSLKEALVKAKEVKPASSSTSTSTVVPVVEASGPVPALMQVDGVKAEKSQDQDKTREKELEEEVKKWKGEWKKMKAKAEEKEQEIIDLRNDLQAEIKLSKDALLTAERKAAAASASAPTTAPLAPVKDAATDRAEMEQIIKLYEDVTNLMVPRVKISVDKGSGGEEVTFLCIQTVEGKSLSFKLKSYKKALPDPSTPSGWKYISQIDYLPTDLTPDKERDRAWVERLGVFAESFMIEREMVERFWAGLREKMGPVEEEEGEE